MNGEPFYDASSGFWDNFRNGPRPLKAEEVRVNRQLEEEIRELQDSGRAMGVELFGRTVPSPVALASGPAPNSAWLEFFADLGYDILTHKTVRDRRWQGHPLPNVLNVEGDFQSGFRVASGFHGTITNSFGMPSADPSVWQDEVKKVLAKCRGKFVVVSVTATADGGATESDAIAQFASLSAAVKRTGAHAVELNLSCPNVSAGEGGEVYADSRLCGRIVDAVRQEVGGAYPLLLKSGFLEDFGPLVEETCDGPMGYVVINSIAAEVRGSGGAPVFADRGGRAGVAGGALFEFTVRAVGNLQKKRESGSEFKILAVGGVVRPAQALELMTLGADVVESATGALHDSALALRIKKALLQEGRETG